jgi:zinc protease
MPRRLISPPLPAWVGDLPVFERTLANGLKALVLPRPQAPVVVCDLYYPVGSVDEPPGRSGLAHFVEHMLFKGTERLPKGQIDRLAFLAAGQINAETGEDLTHYWFAAPSGRWELALAIEADRMRSARFDDPREVEAERQVIAEERARELDSPLGRLDQTHLAVSYLVHPYRNPILGWPEDLQRITHADLDTFYHTHYRPEGAVLVVVGAIEPNLVLERVEEAFSGIRAGPIAPPLIFPVEPRQSGRRNFTLEEPDATVRGLLGWHTVARRHPDGPALDVLADLLSAGRRARLWDRLVDRERLATWVDAAQEPSRLAGQFLIQIEAATGVNPATIEEVIFAEIAALAEAGPSPEELARSRNRLEAAWRWEQEDVFGLASGLGQVALWDDWRVWQAEHRATLAVSADDVRRVASTYLVPSSLTVGWSLPRTKSAKYAIESLENGATASMVATRPRMPVLAGESSSQTGAISGLAGCEDTILPIPSGTPHLADYRPRREILANGLRVVTESRPGSGTVALDLWVDAGALREAKPGLAFLTGRLREEGTDTRSAEALFGEVEDAGGTLDVGSTGISLRVKSEDLEMAVELMADVVLRPSFPTEALGWLRRRSVSELRADRDDPSFRADERFRALIYGDHPYGRDVRGSTRGLSDISGDDIRAHHQRLFKADNAILAAVGDFDAKTLRSLIKTHLGKWSPRDQELSGPANPIRATRKIARRVRTSGEQVHILMGHLGISRLHPDFDAMMILDHILGTGPGFSDRLSRILRDEMGLAYAVGGGMTDSADVVPGCLRIYVGTGTAEADRAVKAVVEQIEAMHRGDFSDDEVRRARDYLAGSWVFDYQTVSQRAERLLELERWGLPLSDPLVWPDRIAAITPEMVRQAAKRNIAPGSLARVEYGPLKSR